MRERRSERALEQTDVVVGGLPQHALEECGGRVKEAAARLGASQSVWKNRNRRRHGVERPTRATVGA